MQTLTHLLTFFSLFGIDDVALAIGGSSLLGGLTSFFGGRQQNQMSTAQMYQQDLFNAGEAEKSRAWSADQAATARQFDSQMMASAEDFSATQAQAGRDFNERQANINRTWEQAMSGTAYQRSVADMKAAGLNPILGISSGGASTPTVSTPGGPTASIGAPTAPLPGASTALGGPLAQLTNPLGSMVSSGLQAAKSVMDFQSMSSSVAKQKADTQVALKQADQVDAQTALYKEQLPVAQQQVLTGAANARAADASATASQAAAGASSAQAGLAGQQAQMTQAQREYFLAHGVLPSTSPLMGVAGPVAAATENIGSAIGHGAASAFQGTLGLLGRLGRLFSAPRAGAPLPDAPSYNNMSQ